MADRLPPVPEHDPLGDRLRSTFAAERADIDRKYSAVQPQGGWWKASTAWIPMAVAAAALAVVGFAFFGASSDDDTVNLDFAAQGQTDWEVPQPEVPGPTTDGRPTAVPLPGFPADLEFPEFFPAEVGTNWCNDWDPTLVIAWQPKQNGEPVPAQSRAETTGRGYVTRQISVGTRVTPVLGCTAGATSLGSIQWHAIEGLPGQPVEWINNQYLISESAYEAWLADGTTPPPSPRPPNSGTPVPVPSPDHRPDSGPNRCAATVFPAKFVWNIAADDPDGGLVAHAAPGIDAPVTRILALDQFVAVTGECRLSPTGSTWVQLLGPEGSRDWASSNFLADPVLACLQDGQFGGGAPVDGVAVSDGDQVAFAPLAPFEPVESPTYRRYPADRVAVGLLCSANPTTSPGYEEPFFHAVQAGDRLGSIAEQYNVTVDVIIRANPQMDPNLIIAGQLLLIPGAATSRVAPGNEDSFAYVPCNATESEVVVGTTERGSASSLADHVHDIRAEQGTSPSGPCTRIVIEFGTGPDSDGADRPADDLPLITIEKQFDSTRVLLPPGVLTDPGIPTRLTTEAGEVLVTVADDLRAAIEVRYGQPGPVNVWFRQVPARVIIDYLNPPTLPTRGPGDPGFEHVVQAGDDISSIAELYDLTAQEIMLANGLENGGANLQVGQVLLIPPPAAAGG